VYRVALVVAVVIGLLSLIAYVQLKRESPPITIGQLSAIETKAQGGSDAELSLPWPATGNAGLSVGGVGQVARSRDDQPRPIASLVKMMTAYVVMKDHPLKAGELGPQVKAEAEDVAIYRSQMANGESVLPVSVGTAYTQRDLLVGLLVPSGNNLAFMLARWSAGSVEAFVERMNQEAAEMGMSATTYADPSGISPQNVSTANDQLLMAEALMNNPVLAGIVGLPQANLPLAGRIFNVNALLGQDSIVGVKTGWTEEAGACFVGAADWIVNGQTVRIFSVVMGQISLADAFNASRRMLAGLGSSLEVATLVTKDGPGTSLKTEWGREATALPDGDAGIVVWPGLQVETSLLPSEELGKTVATGDEVGKIVITAGAQRREVSLKAQERLGSPSLRWRLTRPPSMPW
jgi:D-alanyl-D-alanine carboxypeptidase (penicillin-binding protein 5/6)